jgi:thiamine kinase-like enzyme
LVFSHNDMLANNILILSNGKVALIDFEYASFNFPFYDLANYFEAAKVDYGIDKPPYFAVLP